jgi:hypothetical protein
MRKALARLLIKTAAWLLARDSDRKNAHHIRDTVRVADFPDEIADVLIERGITAHEADVLFRDALKRPPC